MNNKLKLTLGSDPEFVLATSTGSVVSSLDVLKRDKHNPINLGDGFLLYADNVLVEASFPPSSSVGQTIDHLQQVFLKARKELGDGFKLLPVAAHEYKDLPPKPADDLVMAWLAWSGDPKENPYEVHPAWQVGCKPNWDAYARCQRKQSPFPDGTRTGSFHIHIGNQDYLRDGETMLLTSPQKNLAIKLMDIYVGLASIIFDNDPTSHLRKSLYGKAGEYRGTRYGIEYRVLGNYALRSPDLTELVFNLAKHAMTYIEAGTADKLIELVNPLSVQRAINTNDRAWAKELFNRAAPPWKYTKQVLDFEQVTLDCDISKAWDI